ncbi:two-component system response regulator VanR [Microbacterium resistens]|uniref:Two-component system response regulator VanR n=1 Tax=Microbacterium resistens TaxID=156977 RepID=A0ABU1SEI7_9MICO|nr:response regulator transcription factor [Microbacterium resistens]MDR6868021.1 two-component system response regulator VanR [Microbacterium resistens]
MRILVVEDDPALGEALRHGLGLEGFTVDLVADGADALDATEITPYDALVLDRDIPGVHGDEVCARLATRADAPAVLMLTAAGTLTQRISGFELGADDYLPKPFEFSELVVRLRALGRRGATSIPPVLSRAGIELDLFRRTVRRDGATVRLTRKELAVLEVLLRADGGVVSAETLLDKAWDENANPFTNSIRVTVSGLRKKLGEPWVIETVPGSGYRVVERSDRP